MVNGSIPIREFRRVSTHYYSRFSYNEKEPCTSRDERIGFARLCPSPWCDMVRRNCWCRYFFFYTEMKTWCYFTGAHRLIILDSPPCPAENLISLYITSIKGIGLMDRRAKRNYQKGLLIASIFSRKNFMEIESTSPGNAIINVSRISRHREEILFSR